MLSKAKYDHNISLKLSQVMDDIGVNKELVMKRRETNLLTEKIQTLIEILKYRNDITNYFLGSQSEGTTTEGLQSDYDILKCYNMVNVIQNIGDIKEDRDNYLMVTDDNTTKGYCYLRLIGSGKSVTGVDHDLIYTSNWLLRNILTLNKTLHGAEIHGPALRPQGDFIDTDIVHAFPCFSWPHSVSNWFDRKGLGGWPTPEMKRNCISKGFFLVPVGSKISTNQHREWRISTSIAERCLMFSLNITQLRCYVLLKMIANSYLTTENDTKISSFMCKTTLFHCIERSEPGMWRENNLYICVFVCLLQLRFFILSQKCPHFIINENNLMAGEFTGEEQRNLLCTLNNVVHTYGLGLFGIQIDNLGKRLQIKLNLIPQITGNKFQSLKEIREYVYLKLNINIFLNVHKGIKFLSMENEETLRFYIQTLINAREGGSLLDKKACTFVLQEIYTTLGSILASSNIGQSIPISHEALTCLEFDKKSSVSKIIKLASTYYCLGNLKNCEIILRHIQSKIEFADIIPVCGCYPNSVKIPKEFLAFCCKDETELQSYIAYCVRFHKSEFNCIPHELQYELFRSSQDDMKHRNGRDELWMDMSVVDLVPFLYFLQYKVYRHQKKPQETHNALFILMTYSAFDTGLSHKETVLNLLGQCYEDQLWHQEALKCYLSSLQVRKRNNVAKWHICKLLARIMQTK
ncbi:uncharacterized protein LOC132744222 [Ruditapes philippinarum]|uniref:uncharacterized protein LOC132744222 n=1 Tax=Ruditapes philippinarum TaxID=129788 RepID=UPI00295ABAD7|nr:uncharacterized protein LOC132744222 [Ruditapes philippinarum]